MANAPGLDQLKNASSSLLRNLGDKALDTFNDKISDLTEKLNAGEIGGGGVAGQTLGKAGEAVAEGDNPVMGGLKGAASGIKDKITGGGGGGGGGGTKATKSTNITESIDVGVPLTVAYNQWTEFGAFPSFMKKVENVEAADENKLNFKAQIFLSHRTWEATILQQVPDEQIVWRSKGQKGHVDGAVTFHELAPSLTRIIVVLEYYPQGLFEKTGNIWRAQGRRARAEIKHFRRHVMTRTILDPDEVEGWRGRIEDSEVVESHEDALEREQEEREAEEQEQSEDEYDESEEGEESAEEGEESAEEGEEEPAEEEYAEEEPEEEYEEPAEEEEYAEEEPEDVEEDPEEEAAEEEPEDEEYAEEDAEDEEESA